MSSSEPSARPLAVVVGAMNLDVLATASTQAVAGDSTPGSVAYTAGGVGRNIAEGLTRLGVNTRLYSLIGNDPSGDQLLFLCRQAQMNTTYIKRQSNAATSVYVAINNCDGEMQQAINDMSLIDSCTADDFAGIGSSLREADLTVIDANLPESVIKHLLQRERGGLLAAEAVSVNKCVRLRNALPYLDLLKVNLQEAQALVGTQTQSPQDTLAGLLQLGPRAVLMTMGRAGSLLMQRDDRRVNSFSSDAPRAATPNVNGAGDAQFAATLAARLYGYNTAEQLRWGIVAAGLSLTTSSACADAMIVDTLKRMP